MGDASYNEQILPADGLANDVGQTVVGYAEVYNGATWDRMRGSIAADNNAATGLLNVGPLVFDGTNWDRLRSGGVTGMLGVGGDTAAAATDAGNPVKIGGVASTSAPSSVSPGQRVNQWNSVFGSLVVALSDMSGATEAMAAGTDAGNNGDSHGIRYTRGGSLNAAGNWDRIRSGLADGAASTGIQSVETMLFNGATFDRPRSGGVTGMSGVSGDTPVGSADAGNPLKIGGIGSIDPLTAVADGQRVAARFSLYGDLATVNSDPELGNTGGVDFLRHQHAALPVYVFDDSLADGVNADAWTTTNANGGTATSTGGELVVATSANANGSSVFSNTNPPDYVAGAVHKFIAQVRFSSTGLASHTSRFGLFTVSGTTPQDGYYFELTGTTFNAVSAIAGTPTAVASGSWSRQATAPFTVDTAYHRYEIIFTGDSVVFLIDGLARHVLGMPSSPRTATLQLPITIASVNAGSTATNVTIGVRDVAVLRYGLVSTSSNGGVQTSVAASASDTTILAANTSRIGATVYNDSTVILNLLVGPGTSSATVFTVKIGPGGYYEVPFGYLGILKGIWASATGNARVTEFI